MPAWAGLAKSSHKSHTKKAKTDRRHLSSASVLSSPAGVTYSAPTSQPGFDKGWVVCNYDVNGEDSLRSACTRLTIPCAK